MKGNESEQTSAKKLLSVKKAVPVTGLSRHPLYAWVHQRRIPHIKLGSRVVLDRWIESRNVQEAVWGIWGRQGLANMGEGRGGGSPAWPGHMLIDIES